MKNLHHFERFLTDDFLHGKELTVKSCGPWKDFETKVEKGTKIAVIVTKDDTVYPPGKNGKIDTNLFENFMIKIPKINFTVDVGAVIIPVNGNGSIYGDFRNQLSILADDVKVVRGGKDG